MGLIVLPLQCILDKTLVCMISLKSGGGGGGHQHPVPSASYPPVDLHLVTVSAVTRWSVR